MKKSEHFTNLDQPSLLDGEYLARMRRNRGCAPLFGYIEDPSDKSAIVAVPSQLELLREALQYVQSGYSLRRAADWLSFHTGRKMMPNQLRLRLIREEHLQKQRRKLMALEEKANVEPLRAVDGDKVHD